MLVIEVGTLVGFGALVFDVPVRGSLLALAGLCVITSLSFSSLGLLISARPRTIEAVSGITNLVMMPMWIVSGVFFSSSRFPDAVLPLIRALPLTATIDALRANMLQGTPLPQLWPQMAVLAAWGSVSFVVALKVFRWR
jgi:ABC-type multidrug transport system permease subunit